MTADDTSGIKTIAATFADCSVSAAADTTTSAAVTKELTMTAPTTDGLCETDEIIITVTDENNSTSIITRTVVVDNQNPTINVVSPAANTQIVGDTEVRGTTSDGSSGTGVSKVQWFIPDNTVVGAWSGKTDVQKDALFTTTLDGTASWSISFTTGDAGKLSQFFYSTTDSDGNVTWYNKKSASATVTYGTVYSDDIWTLPIYFRIEDETGNYTYYTGYTLNVNPDGDRPTTTITYPETDAVLGGTIRVFGTAEDNELVGSVHMQIQKAGYDSNGALTSTYASVSSSYDDVTVTGTSSWNYSIDGTSATFGAPGTYVEGGSNTYAASANYYNKSMIRVRAWALDSKNLKGAFTDWVYITIDKNAPKIGSTNAFTLVQYSDAALTTVSASQTYTSGMYISGTWYLTCSVEDENGIAEVKLNSETITKTTNDAAVTTDLVLGTSGAIATGTTGYNIKIKLATEGTGIYKFNVYALDKSTPQQSSTSPVYLKFDNTAPVQTALTHGGSTIGDGTGSTSLVQQENYTYLITSSVTEEGSGLKRTAMYLKRTNKDDATNDVRIYDPRFAQTNGSDTTYNRIAIDGTSIKLNDDKLPSKAYTSVTRGNSGTFTLGSADKFITKGSIVRIAGVYRLINSVSGATYTFTPEDTTMNTTVEAVYALVVDDTNYETLTSGVVGNDDGDGIYDYVVDDGSSYSWKLAFNSENIPDGPLSICYVSFDDAGNASELKTVSTKVKNNAPRIAKYTLGTDLNGNGAISEEDETISYSALVKNETTGYYEASDEVTKDVTADFIAKALTTITPEIIGGNNGLKYNWDFYQYDDATSAWGAKTTGAGLTTFTTSPGETYTVKGNSVTAAKGTISLAVDTSTEKLGGKISDGKAKLAFTFWDATEETTAGTDSYSSSLTVTMNVDVVDEVVPKVAIDKFHWTSDTDNSLYGSSTANGHIDLEADLPSSTFNATAGASNAEYDTDPKVSGKIKITGSAYDDHALTALWVHVDDFTFTGADTTASSFRFDPSTPSLTAATGKYYKLATYSNGSWTGSGIALSEETTNGWYFTVTPGYLNQTGHYVTWELDLDTSKLGSVVGLDKKIRVIAVDARSTPNASSETANATSAVSTNNVPYYQVDVVPYVTSITTSLSAKNSNNPSVFTRTSDGHYSIREDESITVNGFNFGTLPVLTVHTSHSDATSVKAISATSSTASTAVFAVKDSGIVSESMVSFATADLTALNNSNLNTAEYNKQPNKANNDLLTDDVYFDVWQFKNIATPAVSALKKPTVKISPSDGMIGASFANLLFFNMAGKRSRDESYGQSASCTQTPYVMSFNGCDDNTFTFDSKGWTYGSVQYQANNSQAKSGYFQMFAGTATQVSKFSLYGNYANWTGACRLEANAITLKESSTAAEDWITNLYRITSPVMVAVPASETEVTVYMAYADTTTHQIRFRKGRVNPTGTPGTGTYLYSTATKDSLRDIISDDYSGANQGSTSVPSQPADSPRLNRTNQQRIHVVANSGATLSDGTAGAALYSTKTTYGAGEYVALGVTSKGVVVLAWHDEESDRLIFTYNTEIDTGDNDSTYKSMAGGDGAADWQKNAVVLDEGCGQYVQMVVDSDDHIHLAYYSDTTGDLKYAYISSYTAAGSAQKAVVDSYLDVGEHCTLNVAKNGDNQVPFIGYYSSKCAKQAYRVDFTEGHEAGAVSDKFTGYWNISYVPSTSSTISEDRVNIGVWTYTDGTLQAIPSGTDMYYESDKAGTNVAGKSSRIYANGTDNPIVAYINKAGALEMAQMK